MTDQQQRPDPGNGYTSADLRSRLSSGVLRLSRRRRMLAILPLVVALVSWFVVPSFAAYPTPVGRHEGIDGGQGRCVYLGANCFHSYQNPATLAYGYFQMPAPGEPGGALNGYCLDLPKQHTAGELMDLTPGAPLDVHVAYIIATHYPARGGDAATEYHGEMTNKTDEAAAVQLAVWAFTNNGLARHPGGVWPSSSQVGGGSVDVANRAYQIRDAAVGGAQAWANDPNQQIRSAVLTPRNSSDQSMGVAQYVAQKPHPKPTPATTPKPTPVMTPKPTPVMTPKPTPVMTPKPTPTTPQVTTTASAQTANVGDSIHDTLAVSGLASGDTATATVNLYGPSAAAPTDTSCTGKPAQSSTVAVKGNGTYQSDTFTVAQAGYYTYQETLPATSTHSAVTTRCAISTETTLVNKPTSPTVTTTASAQTANVGDTIHDTLAVGGLSTGDTTTATVNLYGPSATAPTDTSCTGKPAQSSTVAVKGNGTYQSDSFTVTQAGYYTYQETLPATSTHSAVTTRCAISTETTLVNKPTSPQVTTQASAQSANVGDQIHDTVVVSGSNGYQGTATVNLYGPFPTTPSADSCTTASPVWTGTVPVSGDNTYTTGAYTITQPGNYTYVETLPGDTTHTGVTTLCGETSETTTVAAPVTPSSPVGGVQGIATSAPLTGISTPETGVGAGLARTVIIGLCLIASGMVVVTGLRRNPHAI